MLRAGVATRAHYATGEHNGFNAMLGTNPLDAARPHQFQRMENCRDEGPERFNPIARGPDENQPNGMATDVLLHRHVLVHADQGAELLAGLLEQGAIIEALPTHLVDSLDLVPRKLGCELLGHLLIEENAHRRLTPRGPAPEPRRPALG